jgi:hypothetical protein
MAGPGPEPEPIAETHSCNVLAFPKSGANSFRVWWEKRTAWLVEKAWPRRRCHGMRTPRELGYGSVIKELIPLFPHVLKFT